MAEYEDGVRVMMTSGMKLQLKAIAKSNETNVSSVVRMIVKTWLEANLNSQQTDGLRLGIVARDGDR